MGAQAEKAFEFPQVVVHGRERQDRVDPGPTFHDRRGRFRSKICPVRPVVVPSLPKGGLASDRLEYFVGDPATTATAGHVVPSDDALSFQLVEEVLRTLNADPKARSDRWSGRIWVLEKQVDNLRSATPTSRERLAISLAQIRESLGPMYGVGCLGLHAAKEEVQPLLQLTALPHCLEPFGVLPSTLLEVGAQIEKRTRKNSLLYQEENDQ